MNTKPKGKEVKRRITHILYAFSEPVIADQTFPFFVFSMIQPIDALVNETAKDLRPHEVSNSGVPA